MLEKPDLMTIAEAMQYLRISRSTMHRLMRKHALPYLKLEKKILFRRSEIEKYLESITVKR